MSIDNADAAAPHAGAGGRRPLAIFGTVARAYADAAASPTVVARLVGTWALVLALCFIGLSLTLPVPDGEESLPISSAQGLLTITLMLPVFVALASIAVGWHRFVLLGEKPGLIYLGIGSPVWRYILAFVLMAILTGILVALVQVPLKALTFSNPLALMVVSMIVGVLAMLLMSRFGLALPHIAIGHPQLLGDAFDKSTGNTWRLAIIGILAWMPFTVASTAWEYLPTGISGIGSGIPLFAILFLTLVLVGIAAVGAMSIAYRELWQSPGAGRSTRDR